MEEGRSYFLFELADLQAERRLFDTKPLGRPREVQLFRDCNKIPEMAEFHALTIPQRYRNWLGHHHAGVMPSRWAGTSSRIQ
jgi:hypothetical protein